MKSFLNREKNILVGMLLLIFSAYHVNSSMFYHQHVVCGETIFHSHIYSTSHTSSSEDGGHSLDVVKLIAVLSDFSLEEQTPMAHIEPEECEVNQTALTRPTAQATFFLARTRSLRAPPCM